MSLTIALVLSDRVLVSLEFTPVEEFKLSRNDLEEILEHAKNMSRSVSPTPYLPAKRKQDEEVEHSTSLTLPCGP